MSRLALLITLFHIKSFFVDSLFMKRDEPADLDQLATAEILLTSLCQGLLTCVIISIFFKRDYWIPFIETAIIFLCRALEVVVEPSPEWIEDPFYVRAYKRSFKKMFSKLEAILYVWAAYVLETGL